MSPRKSVVEARQTRQRIIDRGLAIASVDGLEGLTIGRLATEMEMSKAGVLGHFGTKESIQLAVVDAAAEMFAQEVPQRVRDVPPGLPHLRAVCEAWVSYLERNILPGGCFFTAAAAEFDGRGGPVRDAIAGMEALWQRDLSIHIRRAVSLGDLPPDTDPDQLVYELWAVMLALNHFLQLNHDRSAPDRARRTLHRLLGT
ncbi:TetR/AcrR family transcriptional regulator [Amycolatopsis taiwanensis]|uniref:TetR family transcriptional regulator n=1 Tax=Amycolatopsis taiwanensis TaxID=342230 RepID=A0A9W6QU42_9PSEU|nr:TetR/AcrR family transcriptional regulator [Amycolatopsis taiwanensis]GLY64234.1 TetR family transcriptional regulator [Amycolatopsis taiwanensis]